MYRYDRKAACVIAEKNKLINAKKLFTASGNFKNDTVSKNNSNGKNIKNR